MERIFAKFAIPPFHYSPVIVDYLHVMQHEWYKRTQWTDYLLILPTILLPVITLRTCARGKVISV